MPARASLLGLPAELRCNIYQHYVATEDGYSYDFSSGKLTTADGEGINLNLMYTCKLAATEMKGMALANNRITFHCVDTPEMSQAAADFGSFIDKVPFNQELVLGQVRSCIDQDARNRIAERFPQYATPFDNLLRGRGDVDFANIPEPTSVLRQFLEYALSFAAKHDNFAEIARKDHLLSGGRVPDPLDMIFTKQDPWSIPAEGDLPGFEKWRPRGPDDAHKLLYYKHRFSAASAAIRFLKSLSTTTRLQLRNLVLREDRVSEANPECHALGLIPFCQENRFLRIERRINAWRNVFSKESYWKRKMVKWLPRPRRVYGLTNEQITFQVGDWFLEAAALLPAGMPAGAFSLVVDGDPAPERCSEILCKVLLRNCAWQRAWNQWYSQRNSSPPAEQERDDAVWLPQRLLRVIDDITRNSSFIRCNFYLGGPSDDELIKNEVPGWTMASWDGTTPALEPGAWETVHPLPEWFHLWDEDFYQDRVGWDDISRSEIDQNRVW